VGEGGSGAELLRRYDVTAGPIKSSSLLPVFVLVSYSGSPHSIVLVAYSCSVYEYGLTVPWNGAPVVPDNASLTLR
jgi:hypothetical protein